MSVGMDLCGFCKWAVDDPDSEKAVCRAFPDGIPDAILEMEHDHREGYAGDDGIVFEPHDWAPDKEFLDNLFRQLPAVAEGGQP